MFKRPRRNRRTPSIRSLIQETILSPADLVAPFFVIEGSGKREPISALPGIERLTIDQLIFEAKVLHAKGVPAIALFPFIDPSLKNEEASEALNPNGLIPRAIREIKKEIPTLCLISDIALDPYTSHGHDGIVDRGVILNDETVEILVQMSLLYAACGADYVAPSDMMDGRIGAIRKALPNEVGIISYAAKYASSLYSPFREAVGSKLAFGDKKTYQLNPANRREALLEAALDEEEGADMLMVKPALFYLDVIAKMREATNLPICAYHVSGEYAMVMAAHEKGILDAEAVFREALLSIKRAGADFIFSYATSMLIHSSSDQKFMRSSCSVW